MQKEINLGTASFLVASVVLAVLVIVPDVGWIIRQQARILVGGRITPITNPPHQVEDRVLRENPKDYQLQLGGAFRPAGNGADLSEDEFNDTNQRIVARLQALQTQFPSEPSLSAHILRFLCANRLLNHRKELAPPQITLHRQWGGPPIFDEVSETYLPQLEPIPAPEPIDAATLYRMESIAAQGEALDPDNAFFSTMRAIAYLAQKRDREARHSLARAATKPRWDDYVSEEIPARWKLQTAAHGETSAFHKFLVHLTILLPHYSQIRALARVMAAQAAEMERQGKATEGLALRKSLARLGARLRTDCTTANGEQLGGKITLLASIRPGGAPLSFDKNEMGDYEIGEESKRDRYLAYLNHIGATEEARWYAEEWTRIAKVKAIHERAMQITNAGLTELTHLILFWLIGILLLVNALWIFLLGGLAALLARTPHLREGQPLSRSMAWGFGYAIIGPLLVYCIYALVNTLSVESEVFVYSGIPILTGLLALPLFLLKRGTDWSGYGRRIGAFLATVTATLAVVSLFPLSLYGILQSEFYESLTAPCYLFVDIDSITGTGMPLPLFPGILPAICLIGLAVWSWQRKVPASVAMVRGFQKISLPLASLLLLAYAFLVIFTLSSEIEVTKSLEERTHHEGRYLARLIGEDWPGHATPLLPAPK